MSLLVQLAGSPGSGKSTLARLLLGRYSAVVLDLDLIKSTLLDAGLSWQLSGKATYETIFALTDELVGQGHDVVIDSPSHYPNIPATGTKIAARHGARYRFVECVCADVDEIRRRLATRERRRSQMRDVGLPSTDADETSAVRLDVHSWQTHGPDGGHLVVDTTQPLERCADLVFAYLDQPNDQPADLPR